MNSIKKAVSNIVTGNLDEMRQNFSNALMEKAMLKLEDKKIEIAQNYFGFLEEQELSSSQAYQMGQGVEALAKKPFGRPGFNTQGRSALTGTASGTVPIDNQNVRATVTANKVTAPGGYSQSTVSAARPSGSPIGSARADERGVRLTSVGASRLEEMKDDDSDDNNEKEIRGPAIMTKKTVARKMKYKKS